MTTYDEYLVHKYTNPDKCGDKNCRWCNPEPIAPGVCPAADAYNQLVANTATVNVPDDPFELLGRIELQ